MTYEHAPGQAHQRQVVDQPMAVLRASVQGVLLGQGHGERAARPRAHGPEQGVRRYGLEQQEGWQHDWEQVAQQRGSDWERVAQQRGIDWEQVAPQRGSG